MTASDLPKYQAEELSVDHQRLIALINSMTDGVVAVDEDKKIVQSNSVALDVLDANVLTGIDLNQALKLKDNEGSIIDLGNKLDSVEQEFTTKDWQVEYSDGSQTKLFVSISKVRAGYGVSHAGWVILLRDITLERSAEEERDDFISVASHELRTPIAITEGNISNALLAAEKTSVDPTIKTSLKAAHDQVIFLSSLLNDLSMLSRASRGNLAINIEEIKVADFVNSLAGDYRPQAEAKGLVFNTSVGEEIGMLPTSQLYLREILQNFITNSIKYTEKGQIHLSADRIGDKIVFRVKDTGIGISKSDQNKLFKKFFRSDDFRVKKASGTGLGLYVTSKLIKLIGANLSIESELNVGTETILSVSPILPDNVVAKSSPKE